MSRRMVLTLYLIASALMAVGAFLLIVYLHLWGALIVLLLGGMLTFPVFWQLRRSRRLADPSK